MIHESPAANASHSKVLSLGLSRIWSLVKNNKIMLNFEEQQPRKDTLNDVFDALSFLFHDLRSWSMGSSKSFSPSDIRLC